ncbi:MAG: hypothetical protein EXR69_05065 [Myxococcales bacterium]|nr:hypothetical protein [Myxococcales bacterium]
MSRPILLIGLLGAACRPADPPTGVTYYKDIRPILDKNCARCHTDNGIALSFDDADDARAQADAMQSRTQAGTMPPPAPDPDCRPYDAYETYFLTDADKATLAEWAESGAELGDPAEAPTTYAPPTIAPFDFEMVASVPYTPSFDGAGDDYRCFQLDLENESAVYVTGFEALVDNPRIVHHVVLFDSNGQSLGDGTADPHQGFACGGFGEPGWDFVTGWAPGGGPLSFPDGLGLKLGSGAQLVLQMHYFDSFDGAELEQDQSGYAITTTDDVDSQIYQLPVGTYDFTIPAGEEAYESVLVFPWDYGDYDILGVFPHMHTRGSGFDYTVAHADTSSTCLVHMADWDFHNQVTALFDEPARLQEGDAVSLTCTWDNGDNPDDVVWGEGTADEMCFGFTYASKVR